MAKLRPISALLLAAAIAACGPPKKMPNAAYYMGETNLRRGELEQAVQAYQVFITDPGPNPDIYLPRAYYMLAFAYYRQGNYDRALETLDQLERRYPEMNSVQVWTLRGDTSRALQNPVQALQEYDEAWRYSGQMDRVRLETRVSSILREMNVEQLTQSEQLVSDPVMHALVARQLVESGGSLIAAEDRAALADNDAALAAAAPPGGIPRTEERRQAIEAERAHREARLNESGTVAMNQPTKRGLEVPPPDVEPEPLAIEPVPAVVPPPPPSGPGKVVCLAPLSGPQSSIGQKVCNSVSSAFGEAAERVVTQDAGETTGSARGAWMTAADDPSIVACVAWLPPESTQAVAPMAEAAGLPTILVSGAAGSEGRYVREWGPGRSSEMNGLARYMVDIVRVHRFGVFFPDTPAGNDYLDRFSASVRGNGGDLVGKQVYRTGDLDERPLLETLKKWRKRDVNVDAIFIPDQLANVEDLVRQINTDYPDVIVLGLSSWASSTLPLQAFIASGTDTAAFDAASTLYGAVVGGNANTRISVEDRLRQVYGTTTASTVPPTIFRLQNGVAEPVGS